MLTLSPRGLPTGVVFCWCSLAAWCLSLVYFLTYITSILMDSVKAEGQCDKENICDKSDDTKTKIIGQCEFYFSDANILKDQFLLKHVKSSKDGWVELSIIESFKKMRLLTSNHEVVSRALADSKKLEVSEDGAFVRRRDPLPEWDKSVYGRSIIISDFPEQVEVTLNSLTELFTTNNCPPLLVRLYQPHQKIPPDLKRSQVLHPQLGVKLCAVVEFSNRNLARKAIIVAKTYWSTIYIFLLSHGSDQAATSKNTKPKKAKPKNIEVSTLKDRRPLFSWGVIDSTNQVRVIHIREPTRPPTEESLGFPAGWRDSLRLQRQMLSSENTVIPNLSEPLKLPNDNAIVSISVSPGLLS